MSPAVNIFEYSLDSENGIKLNMNLQRVKKLCCISAPAAGPVLICGVIIHGIIIKAK